MFVRCVGIRLARGLTFCISVYSISIYMSGEIHPRQRESYRTLLELVRTSLLLKKAGDRFFQRYALTQSQFNVLMVLKYDAPQGCSQSELSRRMLVNRADIGGLVRRMQERRLVQRTETPGDQRAWKVKVSRQGMGLLRRIEPAYYRRIGSIMGAQSDRENQLFSALLLRTQERIRKHGS
jgi:DNA-binding MarR family transcriptional regulator